MDKVVASAGEAIDGISDGASLAVGGFGLCGIPSVSDLEAGCRKGRWARPLTWGSCWRNRRGVCDGCGPRG